MKKIALTLLALTVVGSAAFAQTNSVLSRNAVGYVRVEVEKGKLELVRNDFEDITGRGIAVTNVVGDQVPVGGSVLLWDYSLQTYIGATRTRSGWGSGGTNRLLRGQSFFIRIPDTAPSNSYVIYLMGEVPDKTTAPTSTVGIVTGIGMYGLPYPVSERFTNTTIGKQAAVGDSVLIWDYATQAYQGATRTRSGWGALATNLLLKPGQGFWYRTASAGSNWSVPKPYTWP